MPAHFASPNFRAMSSRTHRRRVVLFLGAIVVPSLVLVLLSLRMISQERELVEKRLLDERNRRTSDIRQELLTRLERIRAKSSQFLATKQNASEVDGHLDSGVILFALNDKGHLILPWEQSSAPEVAQQLLTETSFAEKIQRGENEELAGKRFDQAGSWYRRALGSARHPIQAAYAGLLLARVLTKLGKNKEAATHYQTILSAPGNVIDEQGVSFWLYAAERIVNSDAGNESIIRSIENELNVHRWLPPTEVYIIRELLEKLVAEPSANSLLANKLFEKVQVRVRETEQAIALQNDFPNLRLASTSTPTNRVELPWVPYGADPWLVSIIPDQNGTPSGVTAVRADDIFVALDSAKVPATETPAKLVFAGESNSESLGDSLPGVRVQFAGKVSDSSRSWTLQSYFYLFTLLLVLSVTTFGGYLLWRDIRREMRLVELRSQFVSSVTHELKTPLTSIRMFAETLRMGHSTGLETQSEYLDTIVNESERLTRLLNNVLDFSKIEQGQRTYRFTSTALPDVIDATARALEYPLAQQGFELEIDVDTDIPQVNADRDALEQAIMNLLTNAMKYSNESRAIKLRLEKQNGVAVIAVVDHGFGIPPDEQSRVFEKFYRAPTPENKRIPGAGLGLTIVDHIAKAHGGYVEVRSAAGEGSTFLISLPINGNQNGSITELT